MFAIPHARELTAKQVKGVYRPGNLPRGVRLRWRAPCLLEGGPGHHLPKRYVRIFQFRARVSFGSPSDANSIIRSQAGRD